MKVRQIEIWIASLNPNLDTESGITRPVLIIQTNLLNQIPHPSTIICPITLGVKIRAEILRVHLKKGDADLHDNCDIMIGQIRTIDNRRLIKRIGYLPCDRIEKVKDNIRILLDLE